MSHPTAGALRWVRSVVLTTVVVGLAAAAHVTGGGVLPSAFLLVALLTTVACATFTVTRWRLRPPAMVLLLGTGQVLLHEVFMALGAPVRPPVAAGGHAGTHLMAQVPGTGFTPDPMLAASDSWSMVLVHVAATVLTAVVLARGEDAVWRLCTWLSPLVRVLRAVLLPVPARVHRLVLEEATWRPRNLLVTRLVSRRGPPPGFLRA